MENLNNINSKISNALSNFVNENISTDSPINIHIPINSTECTGRSFLGSIFQSKKLMLLISIIVLLVLAFLILLIKFIKKLKAQIETQNQNIAQLEEKAKQHEKLAGIFKKDPQATEEEKTSFDIQNDKKERLQAEIRKSIAEKAMAENRLQEEKVKMAAMQKDLAGLQKLVSIGHDISHSRKRLAEQQEKVAVFTDSMKYTEIVINTARKEIEEKSQELEETKRCLLALTK